MDQKAVTYARLTIGGTAFIIFVMFVAFSFIQPELNPLYRFGSEYAAGRMGWLMKLAFFIWGASIFAFGLAMAKGLDPEARSRIGITLFMIAAIGIFLSGVFNSDLQVLNENPPPRWVEPPASDSEKMHIIGGLVAFLGMMPGAGLVSRRLRRAGRLHGAYRWLRYLSYVFPVTFVAFVAVFAPRGLAGLGQRIFLAPLFGWLLLAARGVATGVFSPDLRPRSSTRSPW